MSGYKHPCRYCGQLVQADSQFCPFCSKINPGGLRCVRCHSPIQDGWKVCSSCGLKLEATCPGCGKTTFLGDYCEHCDARLTIICPNRKCRAEQSIILEKCSKCGKPLH